MKHTLRKLLAVPALLFSIQALIAVEPTAMTVHRTAVAVHADDAQWSEWALYGIVQIPFPAPGIFSGVSTPAYDDNVQEVYLRKSLSNPSDWQVRIDNVYGQASMFLDYDYDTKRFQFTSMVQTGIPVPQAWIEGMGDAYQPCESILMCDMYKGSSLLSLLGQGNLFYPEAGVLQFGSLGFLGGSGKPGTDAEGYYYGMNYNGQVRLVAPQADRYNVSFGYGGSHHFTAEAAAHRAINVSVGDKVKAIRLVVIPERYSLAMMDNPFRLAQEDFDLPGGRVSEYPVTGGQAELPPLDIPAGSYIVLVLAVDDSGEPVYQPEYFFASFNTEDSRRWAPAGKGSLQDRTLFKYRTDIPYDAAWWAEPFFNSDWSMKVDNPVWEVEVEEAVDFPGIYRIRNPYFNHPSRENLIVINDQEWDTPEKYDDYYIYVDATDPDMVLFEPSFDGIGSFQLFGPLRNTYAYYYVRDDKGGLSFDEENISDLCGRMRDGRIVFPLFTVSRGGGWRDDPYPSVSASGGDYSNPDWMLTLPEASVGAVENGGVADAPIVYYNLQGIPIANPVHGEVYLEKCGASVRKVVTR